MELRKYDFENDIKELYKVFYRAFEGRVDVPNMDTLLTIMKQREGFTIINGNEIVGCVLFDHIVKGHDANIHCFVNPEYQGKWMRKRLLNHIFDYAFDDLGLARITSVQSGLTDNKVEDVVMALGFKPEGVIRNGYKLNNSFYDLKMYGLLKEERRY